MTIPAISSGGERAVVDIERRPEPRGEQRDHLACRGARGLDPVGGAGRVVRGVVVDDDARQPAEQVGVAVADRHRPDRARRSR